MPRKKIGIIGCGNMGQAIVRCLLSQKHAFSVTASDSDAGKRASVRRRFRIRVSADNADLAQRADIIILAIKPQDLDAVLSTLAKNISGRTILISIAAGVTTRHIEDNLAGTETPVIRVMPNMSACVGMAISAVCKGRHAKRSHMAVAKRIFSTIGETVTVNERSFDAVTAVSGSGPAYFFYLMESMIAAAVGLGLAKNTARQLVEKTALGSALVIADAKEDAAALRKKVTSKGGTTEEAFKIFKSKQFKRIICRAIRKAAARSEELSR